MSTISCIGGTEVLGDWRPTRTEISDISCRERLAHEAVTKLFDAQQGIENTGMRMEYPSLNACYLRSTHLPYRRLGSQPRTPRFPTCSNLLGSPSSSNANQLSTPMRSDCHVP